MEESIKLTVDEHEKKLIEIIREINYGELKVLVQDGLPIRLEQIKKSIKL